MTVDTRFVFDKAGRLFREDVTVREIAITPDIAAAMLPKTDIATRNIINHPTWGQTGLLVETGSLCWWTVRLKALPMRCPYHVNEEGIMVPELDSQDDPVLTREWVPPADMKLVFLMSTVPRTDNTCQKNGYAYLFAMDKNMDAYRFPIGNLFDDCHLCLGNEEFMGDTHMEVLGKTLEQFSLSEWNNDLWTGADKRLRTQELFQFKANNEKFEQLPSKRHWTALAYKVSVALTDKVVV